MKRVDPGLIGFVGQQALDALFQLLAGQCVIGKHTHRRRGHAHFFDEVGDP